jgi:radical SAM-linked protein
LGFSSRAEIVDFWTTEEIDLPALPDKLAPAMPAGLRVLSIEQVDERAPALQTEVSAAEYMVQISDPGSLSGLDERITSVLVQESIPHERRGKTYDLRPLIEELQMTGDGQVFMRLTAREGATGRPEEVLDVLDIPPEVAQVERTRLIMQPAADRR